MEDYNVSEYIVAIWSVLEMTQFCVEGYQNICIHAITLLRIFFCLLAVIGVVGLVLGYLEREDDRR